MGSAYFDIGQYSYSRHDHRATDMHTYARWSPGETKTVTIPSMVSGYEYVEGDSLITVEVGFTTATRRTYTVYLTYGEEKSGAGRWFSYEYIPPSTIIIENLLDVTLIGSNIELTLQGFSISEVNAKLLGMYKEYTSVDDMPSSVSDGTRTYSVTSAWACYKNSAIQNAPALSSNIVVMNECFANCSQLVTAPTIPSGVEIMSDCFSGCRSLTQAPEIPDGILDLWQCFKNCVSLQGNIVVHSFGEQGMDIDFAYMFEGTVNDIYIIDRGTDGDLWKEAAEGNVHYEADDAIAPVITNFNAIRVDASGDTTPEPTGLYAYVTAKLSTDKTNIPVGWTNEIKTKILTDNGSTESPTWHSQSGTDPLEVWCWISLGDTSTHELTFQIADSIKEGATEKKSQQSQVVYASILKSYALVDYYHDENASGVTEGMAIGKYAEYANLLDIDMPTKHRQDIECPDMTAQEVQDFIDSLEVGGGGTAVDLVVEQGTSGIWTYRKWSSGIAECWGHWETGAFAGTLVNNWYCRVHGPIAFPVDFFTAVPYVNFSLAYWNTGYFWGGVRTVSKDQFSIHTINNSASSSGASGDFYAIGKWK